MQFGNNLLCFVVLFRLFLVGFALQLQQRLYYSGLQHFSKMNKKQNVKFNYSPFYSYIHLLRKNIVKDLNFSYYFLMLSLLTSGLNACSEL